MVVGFRSVRLALVLSAVAMVVAAGGLATMAAPAVADGASGEADDFCVVGNVLTWSAAAGIDSAGYHVRSVNPDGSTSWVTTTTDTSAAVVGPGPFIVRHRLAVDDTVVDRPCTALELVGGEVGGPADLGGPDLVEDPVDLADLADPFGLGPIDLGDLDICDFNFDNGDLTPINVLGVNEPVEVIEIDCSEQADCTNNGGDLSWTAVPDISSAGYHVRAVNADGTTSWVLTTSDTFANDVGPGEYIVRYRNKADDSVVDATCVVPDFLIPGGGDFATPDLGGLCDFLGAGDLEGLAPVEFIGVQDPGEIIEIDCSDPEPVSCQNTLGDLRWGAAADISSAGYHVREVNADGSTSWVLTTTDTFANGVGDGEFIVRYRQDDVNIDAPCGFATS